MEDRKKILVIEDDEDTNEMVCVALRNAGYETESAFDGEEGLKKVIESAPDAIILDIMMPKLDGIGVCRALKCGVVNSRGAPIIMLTAKGSIFYKLESLICGASHYVVKPFDFWDLTDLVGKAIAQRYSVIERNETPEKKSGAMS